MWCDRCRADVAAEIVSATGRARCGTCEADLGTIRRPANEDARELLRRWAAESDETSPQPEYLTERHPSRDETVASGKRNDADLSGVKPDSGARPADQRARSGSPSYRADDPHPPGLRRRAHGAPPEVETEEAELPVERPAIRAEEKSHPRADRAHSRGPSAPHFDVHTAIAVQSERAGQGAQLVGQLLAYAGVLALTLGTAIVIWGYFGGPADHASTGWLIATGGQMLLFLGVVTLVSGGLEQTSREVRVRVESLGDRLIRIEQATADHALKGPHTLPKGVGHRHHVAHQADEDV